MSDFGEVYKAIIEARREPRSCFDRKERCEISHLFPKSRAKPNNVQRKSRKFR